MNSTKIYTYYLWTTDKSITISEVVVEQVKIKFSKISNPRANFFLIWPFSNKILGFCWRTFSSYFWFEYNIYDYLSMKYLHNINISSINFFFFETLSYLTL